MRQLAILGSTGSIGQNTLNVARHLKDHVRVVAIAAKSNIDLLEKQAIEFKPELIAVYEPGQARLLRKRLPGFQVVEGMEGMQVVASLSSANLVISAMTGTLGLVPTIAAIKAGKTIGLANKEALVSGGSLVTSLAKAKGVKILPIDSEHSAIFQCLDGENSQAVHRLILTASGGPFRHFTTEQLAEITVDKALQHPTWNMGPKITIDSSTLMNKGLEVIEAHWLFGVPVEKIEVVVHPQSIIHSMVEYQDGSILAQMSEPSMIVPIQYAITYPVRHKSTHRPFNFLNNQNLQFIPPDSQKFRCLALAYDAIRAGKSLPCYMNAANEILVHRFLNKEIGWQDIAHKLECLMQQHQPIKVDALDAVLAIDAQARKEAERI